MQKAMGGFDFSTAGGLFNPKPVVCGDYWAVDEPVSVVDNDSPDF